MNEFSRGDIGTYFIDDNEVIYECIGWCAHPTAILKNIETGENQHIVHHSQQADDFTRLVPERYK